MSLPNPPRPGGVGRPGTARRAPPERSISPVPATQRPEELAKVIPGRVIEATFVSDPEAAREADAKADREARLLSENTRLRERLAQEQLPSPKRARESTKHDWPPQNGGYLPGMPESMPPMRGKLESHQHLHVILEREARARDESLPPRSARQRAGDAIKGARQPLLVTLISTILSGGGVTAILTARESQPEMPATSVGAGVKLKENQRNLAADLAANDRGDRAHEKWDIEEHRKFDERLRQCERKQRRMPDESLEPEAPPAAPPPPRKPDLPERIGQ